MTQKMKFFQDQVEIINNEFGGINAIKEQIKIAKMKEQSVGKMISNLDTCIVSYFRLYL